MTPFLSLTSPARTPVAVPLATLICYAPEAAAPGGTRLYTTRGTFSVLEDAYAVEHQATLAAARGRMLRTRLPVA